MKQETKFDARNMTTDEIVAAVAPLCGTATFTNDVSTTLHDWIANGSFDGTETPESLAAEWDAAN